MEWQSENERGLKREIVDEMEVCSARMSHDALHSIFFHSVFAALVWDVSQYLSLSHSHVFAAHTVLTKTTKDSQIKTRLVFDISLELHTLWWISVVFGLHLLSWLQKHMCEECLIVEPRRDRLTDRFLSLNVGAARQSPVDVLKCGCLKELSALPAPWQVMDRGV